MSKNVLRHAVCRFCRKEYVTCANRQVFCSLECRFLSETGKPGSVSQCWFWEGGTDRDGYGQFRWAWEMRRAHRTSYELFRAEVPDGLIVMHSCDQPSCVNPFHLSVGTPIDNNADRHVKGHTRANPRAGNNGRGAFRINGRFARCGV